jgi:hypothetical protein
MGAKIQAFDIFQTPLSSHYPLPLSQLVSNTEKEQGPLYLKRLCHEMNSIFKVLQNFYALLLKKSKSKYLLTFIKLLTNFENHFSNLFRDNKAAILTPKMHTRSR